MEMGRRQKVGILNVDRILILLALFTQLKSCQNLTLSDFLLTAIWFSAKLWVINRIYKLSEHRAAAFQRRNQNKITR